MGLMKAIMRDDPNVVKILLERGADVNADSEGWTAMHFAASYGRIELMELLLEFEAEIDAIDNWEETPLMKAVRSKDIDAVELLLERDARLDLKNKYEETV